MGKIAIIAAALFALVVVHSPAASAQEYMKAAPSDAKAAATAPASSSAKKKAPKVTQRCLSPGGKTSQAC